MRTLRLPDFLRELPPPLGYQGIRIEESKLNKIIFCLNIKDHLGRVYYPEVMWTIFHSIVGINDEKVNNCEQIINILKIVKKKYKGLGKRLTLTPFAETNTIETSLLPSSTSKLWKSWLNGETSKTSESSKRSNKWWNSLQEPNQLVLMRFQRRNQWRVFNTMMRLSNKFNRVRERMTLDATSTRMNPNSSSMAMIVIT